MAKPSIPRTCEQCGNPFLAKPGQLKIGKARFCSRLCAQQNRYPPLKERFWAQVRRADTCLLWTGAVTYDGYGMISETVDGKRLKHMTHRLSYQWAHGEIPNGQQVMHTCDTPACVNPAHLTLGTAKDNAEDRMRKHRACHRNCLSKGEADAIRARYQQGDITYKQVSKIFDVHTCTVQRIVKGQTHT